LFVETRCINFRFDCQCHGVLIDCVIDCDCDWVLYKE
jgi:hypothetical protein